MPNRGNGFRGFISPVLFPAAAFHTKQLQQSYKSTFPAVDKMLSEIHDQGLGIILDKPILFATQSSHLADFKWTDKRDKRKGRQLTDITFCAPPSLNGDWASAAAAEMYGSITHPTIVQIVIMILDA